MQLETPPFASTCERRQRACVEQVDARELSSCGLLRSEWLVISYGRFGTTRRSRLQGSRIRPL